MNARTMMTAAVSAAVALSARAGVVDLGVVDAHRKVECGFAITNNSSSSWAVQGARSSCARVAVEVRRGELKAGEVLPVNIDPAAVRQFSKQLEISTDLPENGILKIPLQVEF